jgi:tRNA-dihydrouridine synthase
LITEPSARQKIETAKLHLERLINLKGEKIACREFRQHASYYLKGISRSTKTKVAINQTEDKQVIFDLLDRLVEKTETKAKIS